MSQLPHPFNEPNYLGLIFMAEYSPCTQSTQLFIARRKFEGGRPAGTERAKLVWEEADPRNMPEPAIVCHDSENYQGKNQFQFLFDSLWQLGFRPPKHDPSGEVIQAKDQNLDDLRKILFNQLGVTDELV